MLPRQIRACRVRPIPINQALLSRTRGRVIYYKIFMKENEASNFWKQAGNHVSSMFAAPDNYLTFITPHSFQFYRENFKRISSNLVLHKMTKRVVTSHLADCEVAKGRELRAPLSACQPKFSAPSILKLDFDVKTLTTRGDKYRLMKD